MPSDRQAVVVALGEIADLLEVKGESPFKCRAFSQAARAVSRTDADIRALAVSGKLTSIRGVGKSTAKQIESLLLEGSSPLLDELRAGLPEGILEILELPGLGPKRVRTIYERLGVGSTGELEYAIYENRLRDLPGFGVTSQGNLLEVLLARRRYEGHFLLTAGWAAAAEILAANRAHGRRMEIAGELRRQVETITEVLFIAELSPGASASQERIEATNGLPVRILSRSPEIYEAAWLWESSSPEHRSSLQARAAERGLDLSENGLRRGGEIVPLDEAGIYDALGLEPVHPLLRERPAGDEPQPPVLAGPESIRGVFHVHTSDSDGTGTLEEMVTEAERLGYLWIGIADHSQAAFYAMGLSPERIREQRRSIDEVQKLHPKIRILHGIESDILADGSLDYKDDVLAELDFVVASVHSQMRIDSERMTQRIATALRHPATTHWGHPTGRLLLGREGYECDMEHLLRVCAEEGVSVEFNANPHRLDIDWRWIPRARALQVPVSVNPDAHSPGGLADARLTVGTAAKGGLTPNEPLNNRSAEEIESWLKQRKKPQSAGS